MARPKSIDIARELNNVLSVRWLRRTARELGMVVRQRKVDAASFVYALIFGVSVGSGRSLASLRRFFMLSTDTVLAPSSFYKRFTKETVVVLRAALDHVLERVWSARAADAPEVLGAFKDLLATDGSILRLHDFLAKRWRASRTNHTQAAARLHLVMSVVGHGARRVALTGERASERDVLKVGPWIRGHLLLMDLGYYCFGLFDRVDRHGGFFLSRLKSNANLRIIQDNRRSSSPSAVELTGQMLASVREGLGRAVVDVMVEVKVPRGRKIRGRQRRKARQFRMVGIRHDATRSFHWYITNIPLECLEAEQMGTVYAMRWEVELVFRELKSQLGLGELSSSNQHVIESLIYAAVIGLLQSRRLWQVLRARGRGRIRISERRVTEMLRVFALEVVTAMLRCQDRVRLRRRWHRLLWAESCDPNRTRALSRDLVMVG